MKKRKCYICGDFVDADKVSEYYTASKINPSKIMHRGWVCQQCLSDKTKFKEVK